MVYLKNLFLQRIDRCCKVTVMNDEEKISQWMDQLGIAENDLIEKFILASGRGGQKVQKTSSCVYLKHIPTGIEIKCQETRSREQNRYFARIALCNRIQNSKNSAKIVAQKRQHLKKQAKRGRSKASKAKMLDEKRRISKKKSMRRKPSTDDS